MKLSRVAGGLAPTSVILVFLFVSSISAPWAPAQTAVPASTAQVGESPVAVIVPLPDVVSNGTWWDLDGMDSYDPDGILVTYTWALTVGGTTTFLYAMAEPYKFTVLGLYKITLTVEDNEGNTGVAFTAVYSVSDSDGDMMPDWWESYYFDSMDYSGTGDFDGDGYTNLEEYASGDDPTAKNPQPGFVDYLVDNWVYVAIAAAVIAAVLFVLMSKMKKTREKQVKEKIEAAIEIEKELGREE